jgi:hypothetical protein
VLGKRAARGATVASRRAVRLSNSKMRTWFRVPSGLTAPTLTE